MQIIPIDDTYAQTLSVQLGGQNCQINLYQKSTGLFCDLLLLGNPVIQGVECVDTVKIVRNTYLGFQGDLVFYDTQGSQNPSSPGLGTRYLFYYLTLSDLNGAG